MNKTPSQPDANEFWTPRRFLLVLSLVMFAVFPKVALGLNTFFFRDFGTLGYPGANYFRECLQHGEFPLWNPYSHCGTPYMAQMGSWYVPAWICALLPQPWSVTFPMLVHLVLGGFGAYSLARRWGAGGFAASFAGFAYTFNGVSLSCFQWGNYLASLCWLPWVIIWVSEAWRHGGRWLVLAALASAMQVLTGTPELTLLGWMLLAAVWLSAVISREIKIWPSAWRVALVILIASGITMVQMLPFFDLLAHSQRDTNYEEMRWAMPPWGWANFFVPLFHCYRSPQGIWYQWGQEFLLSYYLGAGVLALAVAGALWTRTRLRAVIVGTILFCWIMALGDHGYLYAWVKKVFPYIGVARFTVKFTILTSLLIPLLAAWGLQQIQSDSGKSPRRGLVVIGGSVLAIMGSLLWFARQHPLYPVGLDFWNAVALNTLWCAGLVVVLLGGILLMTKIKSDAVRLAVQFVLLGIVLAEAFTHSWNIVPTLPSLSLKPGMWQDDGRTPPKLGEGRIMISPDAEARISSMNVKRLDYDFTGRRLSEWANLNLLDMVPKVTGAQTLRPAHFDRIERYLYYTYGTNYSSGFLDFLSASWFSSPMNPVEWVARTNFLPVMTAGQRPIFLDDTNAMTAMTMNDFDARAVVYLPASERALITVSNQTTCVLRDVQFRQNSVEANVDAAAPSLVVLSQTFYHLWHAEVDGKEVPLLRANVAFQALQVPAGPHHVKLIYRDPNFVIGGVISLLSILACGVIWFCTPLLRPKVKSN